MNITFHSPRSFFSAFFSLTCLVSFTAGPFSFAQEAETTEGTHVGEMTATPRDAERLFGGKNYSPYAGRSFPSTVYWGDTHLHTALSVDAGLFGGKLGLEEAYRFCRGEEVVSATGQAVKLARPLDWVVIADHSDAMGFIQDLSQGDPAVTKFEQGKRWYEGFSRGGQDSVDTALDLITNFAQGTIEPALLENYMPGAPKYDSVWGHCVKTAEQFNDPGTFTTLIGFEWTSLVKGNNLHRNVIFRDGADKAGEVVPMVTQEPFGSTDPLKLYEWLANYREKTGGRAFCLAHNGNLSNGLMFPIDKQYTGRKLDKTYVEARAKWELLYEITQIKGDGEAHPFLSPDDEFADYETWDVGNLDITEAKTPEMLAGEYGREALKRGLVLKEKFGTNPYKFGFVGSTDSHTSLPAVEEENFFGKHAGSEPSPERMRHPFSATEIGRIDGYQQAASGLAAVWATENTREGIYDAMERKETYATTGPRMMVRFFGGWEFTEDDLSGRNPVFNGYAKGVPMGGDLTARGDAQAPTFMVYSLRDPIGANLDRIQIIKGWLEGGETKEKIYNVAWSGDRQPDENGKLPAVGNTVDVEQASWKNTIGASELGAVWTDPDFNPDHPAVYYARVLEIPTPRWVVYDAFRFGIEIPEGAETSHQERAYTSPIWYSPEG